MCRISSRLTASHTERATKLRHQELLSSAFILRREATDVEPKFVDIIPEDGFPVGLGSPSDRSIWLSSTSNHMPLMRTR